MPVDTETLAQFAAIVQQQLTPLQNTVDSLQTSLDARMTAVNNQLSCMTTEQGRLAREQMKQAQDVEARFQKIREEIAAMGAKTRRIGSPLRGFGLSSSSCSGSTVESRSNHNPIEDYKVKAIGFPDDTRKELVEELLANELAMTEGYIESYMPGRKKQFRFHQVRISISTTWIPAEMPLQGN